MKQYELICLIKSDITDEELASFGGVLGAFISEEGGSVEKTSEPIKKRLAYFIKKRKEAYLITLAFSISPEKLLPLESKIRKEGRIIRHSINAKVAKKFISDNILGNRSRSHKVHETEEKPKVESVEAEPPVTHKNVESQKVELNEIDEKIDEILKE